MFHSNTNRPHPTVLNKCNKSSKKSDDEEKKTEIWNLLSFEGKGDLRDHVNEHDDHHKKTHSEGEQEQMPVLCVVKNSIHGLKMVKMITQKKGIAETRQTHLKSRVDKFDLQPNFNFSLKFEMRFHLPLYYSRSEIECA